MFGPSTIIGLSHDYPNLAKWLKENLNPLTEKEFRKAESQCLQSNIDLYAGKNMDKYFKRGYASILEPIPLSVIQESGTYSVRS